MGRPKLVLPWGGATILQATLAAWNAAGLEGVYVTVRRDDAEAAALARTAGAVVVQPEIDPPDMRASVATALSAAEADEPLAAWLLAPADMPWLDATVARRLIEERRELPTAILVPTYHGRRGHPVLFPGELSQQVRSLASGGINQLVRDGPTREVVCDSPRVLYDLDTPEDYAARRREFDEGRTG